MGNRLHSAWLAGMLTSLCAVMPVCADASDGNTREAHMKRQVEEFEERVEAKRRDSQARCESGDREACSDAVCLRLMTEGPSAARYQDCSRAQGLKTTDRWVQAAPLKTSSDRQSVHIVCLTEPDVMKLGGKEMKLFRQFLLEADTERSTAIHARNRFYTDVLGGPDFATWEAGAEALCKTENRPK